MADKKVSELTAITSLSGDDLLLVVNDPAGSPTSRKITLTNFFANVVPQTVHKADVFFNANTIFQGSLASFTSNVNITSALRVSNRNIIDELNNRYTIANAIAQFANSDNAILTGNTSADLFLSNYVITERFILTDTTTNIARSDTGLPDVVIGEFLLSNSYIYFVSGTNFIKRVPLQTFFNSEDVNVKFTVRTNANTGYQFIGGGTAANTDNETLYLYKGMTYQFYQQHGNTQPLRIVNSLATGNTFSNGVSGVGTESVFFTVPQVQVSNLHYESSVTANTYKGTIVII
jgi:hypothetical protein